MTKPSKSPTGWIFVATCVALVMLGTPVYFLWRQFSGKNDYQAAASQLDSNVKEARALGLPLVANDLAPNPPIPDDKNAAVLYFKALGAMPKSTPSYSDIQVAAESGDISNAAKWMRPFAPGLDLAVKASALPNCDFKRDWDRGPDLTFPDFAGAKYVVKMLCFRAEFEAAQGKHDAAIADLKAASAFANDVGSDPCMISALVDIACQAIALRGVERCLAFAKGTPAIKKYEAFLDSDTPGIDAMRVLRGECFMGVTLIRNIELFGMPNNDSMTRRVDPDDLRRTGMPTEEKARAFMSRHLEIWNEVFTAAKVEKDPLLLYNLIDVIVQRKADDKKGPSFLLESILSPVYSQAGQAIRKNASQWQITRALAKVLDYQQQHGKYPAALADVGFNEIDPFSGHPYGYIVEGDNVRVYSVSRDGVDNQGLRRVSSLGKQNQYDDVASYPPASAAKPLSPPVPNVIPRTHPKPAAKR